MVQDTLVPQINNKPVELIVSEVIANLIKTAELLADENQDNKEQLIQLWGEFSTTPRISESLNALFTEALNGVQDVTVKSILTTITPEVVATVQAVTDRTKPDGQQIEAIWKSFIKSPKFVSLILENATFLLSKLNLPEWLRKIVEKLLPKK